MEDKATVLESLADKAGTYAKTNIDLFKLKATDKISDATSSVALKIIYLFCTLLILIMVNFGLALWIGEEIGESYAGFFIVALFYIILTLLIYVFRKKVVTNPIKNAVIERILEEKQPNRP